jgi:hypothetical protein
MTIEVDAPPPPIPGPDPGLDKAPSIAGTAEGVLAVVVVLLVVRLGLTFVVAAVLDPWRHGYAATWLWVGQLTGNTHGALLGWIGGSVASIAAAVLLTRGRRSRCPPDAYIRCYVVWKQDTWPRRSGRTRTQPSDSPEP